MELLPFGAAAANTWRQFPKRRDRPPELESIAVGSPHFRLNSHERVWHRKTATASEAQRKAAAQTALKSAKWVLCGDACPPVGRSG
jgi:hypothetical protein